MLTNISDYLNEVSAKYQTVGTWGFNSNKDFSKAKPEEINVWFFEQVFNFLRSFFGLVLPDNLELITYNATQHIKKENLEQQTFLDELMLIMKNLKEPIWTLRLNLNIVGFLRTAHNPDNTIRIQIQEPSSFIAWGGPDETGFQNFSISYKLFNETVLEGTNEMLWSVNQPLLEKALHKWERQTGHAIEEVHANTPGVPTFRHGFGAPKKTPVPVKRQSPAPSKQPTPQQSRALGSTPPPPSSPPTYQKGMFDNLMPPPPPKKK